MIHTNDQCVCVLGNAKGDSFREKQNSVHPFLSNVVLSSETLYRGKKKLEKHTRKDNELQRRVEEFVLIACQVKRAKCKG